MLVMDRVSTGTGEALKEDFRPEQRRGVAGDSPLHSVRFLGDG